MKRNVFIMALLFIMSSLTMELIAQENLNALVKKCETMSSVDMGFVRTKNSQTKKLETKIINITINQNQALINEFLAAFKKDEENALNVIEDKKGGVVNHLHYKFNNVTYTLSMGKKNIIGNYDEKEGCASVSIIY